MGDVEDVQLDPGDAVPFDPAAQRVIPAPGPPPDPTQYRRGYLTEGHQAQGAQGIGGVPAVARDVARAGRVAAKQAPRPSSFRRGNLTARHQADAPANTGRQAAEPMPVPHPAEPQAFRRGWLAGGHQDPSPADRPANNPHQGGTPGGQVYATAAGAYNANRDKAGMDHVAMTGQACSQPAPARWSPPAEMGAANVPHSVAAGATRIAPVKGDLR